MNVYSYNVIPDPWLKWVW